MPLTGASETQLLCLRGNCFQTVKCVGVGELQKWFPLTKLHFYNEENVPHQLFQKNWQFIELIDFIGGDLPPEPRVAAIADIQIWIEKLQNAA